MANEIYDHLFYKFIIFKKCIYSELTTGVQSKVIGFPLSKTATICSADWSNAAWKKCKQRKQFKTKVSLYEKRNRAPAIRILVAHVNYPFGMRLLSSNSVFSWSPLNLHQSRDNVNMMHLRWKLSLLLFLGCALVVVASNAGGLADLAKILGQLAGGDNCVFRCPKGKRKN